MLLAQQGQPIERHMTGWWPTANPQRTALPISHVTGGAPVCVTCTVDRRSSIFDGDDTLSCQKQGRGQGGQGFTGLMAPWTPFRMVKGRLWLFISRKPISADCVHNGAC